MAKLILHVGPGKCGSTSIQRFFGSGTPCTQNVRFQLLDPVLLWELDRDEPNEATLGQFVELLTGNVAECDTLIVSHEVLFKRPRAVRHICRLANGLFAEKIVVGYSRRQSEFLVSAYAQWLFRSPERIKETTNALIDLNLDPVLFSGVERHTIASITNDFHSARQLDGENILNWHAGYQRLSRSAEGLGVEIKCGVLPGKESAGMLISDFCEKCGLTLREDAQAASQRVANTSFSPGVVEAVDNAITLGFDAPAPDQLNRTFQLLSSASANVEDKPSEFLFALKSYVDSFYWQSNQLLCRDYGLSAAYFAPSRHWSKEEILGVITSENQRRGSDPSTVIAHYRTLAARMVELCLQLAKEPLPRTKGGAR